MKAVILCGGLGTRLKEQTEFKPKPMVEIAGKPILWHIMKIYSHYRINKFILCLGFRGDVIKDYFCNYKARNYDFTLNIETSEMKIHNQNDKSNWEITFADTGLNSMTGARIKKIMKYIDDDVFMMTYGDGVSNINIKNLLEFHKSHGKIATITGVLPPSRFGEIIEKENYVTGFDEKPHIHSGRLINGGFFVFNKKIFDYLSNEDDCIFERKPMEKLVNDMQLSVYKHYDFWQCMDTFRDYEYLNNLWNEGEAHWKIWE